MMHYELLQSITINSYPEVLKPREKKQDDENVLNLLLDSVVL